MKLRNLQADDWVIATSALMLLFYSFVGEHSYAAPVFLAAAISAAVMSQVTRSRVQTSPLPKATRL